MSLCRLELQDFKSYKGKQTIGPFTRFTAIIGPNGSGKSNLMDAISFVLGVKTRDLRGAQLNDLVFGANSSDVVGGSRASVTAVLKPDDDDDGTEIRFTRTITGSGGSEYRIDGKVVSAVQYTARLETFNLIVKARNFLVFQGDVEAIAQKNPVELAAMFESVCGSDELKEEYESLQREKAQAEERLKFAQQKKKSFTAEKKQYKEQKDEAERFAELEQEKAEIEATHIIWQLFYHERDICNIEKQRILHERQVQELTSNREQADTYLKTKKKEMAKAQKEVSKLQNEIKTETKKLDKLQPKLIKIQEESKHADKKRTKAEKDMTSAMDGNEKHEQEIEDLEQSLKLARKHLSAFEKKTTESVENIVLNETQLKEYHTLKEIANSKSARVRAALDKKKREHDTTMSSLTQTDRRLKEVRDEIKTRTEERDRHSVRVGKLEKLINVLETEYEDSTPNPAVQTTGIDKPSHTVLVHQEKQHLHSDPMLSVSASKIPTRKYSGTVLDRTPSSVLPSSQAKSCSTSAMATVPVILQPVPTTSPDKPSTTVSALQLPTADDISSSIHGIDEGPGTNFPKDSSIDHHTAFVTAPMEYAQDTLAEIRAAAGRTALVTLKDMSLEDLVAEKNAVKQILIQYDLAFQRVHSRLPTRHEKSALKGMYTWHKAVKTTLQAMTDDLGIPLDASVVSVVPRPTPSLVHPTREMKQTPDQGGSHIITNGTVNPTIRAADTTTTILRVPEQHSTRRHPLSLRSGATSNTDGIDSDVTTNTVVTTSSADESIGVINASEQQQPSPAVPGSRIVVPGATQQTQKSFLSTEKKRLHALLHDFEQTFLKTHGHLPQSKSDRSPMAAEFERYRHVKELLAKQQTKNLSTTTTTTLLG